jgi:phosphocarrier protein HPr
MVTVKVKVLNELGLHARPVTKLIRYASKYQGKISIIKEEKYYNAASMLELMMLNAKYGDILHIEVHGTNEEIVAEELLKLFESKFGEV